MKKKLLYPIAFALNAFLILYSCSAEEEDTTPPPNIIQTQEPETPATTQYNLTVSAGGGGTVSTEGGTYDEGTEVTITATPDDGYEFVGWEGSNSMEASLTLTLGSNTTLNALFGQIPVLILPPSPSKMFTRGVADTLSIGFISESGFKSISIESEFGNIQVVDQPEEGSTQGNIIIEYNSSEVKNINWRRSISGFDDISIRLTSINDGILDLVYRIRTQPQPKIYDYNKSYDNLKSLGFPIDIPLIRNLNRKDVYVICEGNSEDPQSYYDYSERITKSEAEKPLNQFDILYGDGNSFNPDNTNEVLFADFNNDGYLDFFTHPFYIGIDGHGVYKSEGEFYFYENGDFVYKEIEFSSGNTPKFFFTRKGTILGDFDNDGDADIIISSVDHDNRSRTTNTMLLENKLNENEQFKAHDYGFGTHFLYTGSGDIDQDGDLDVLVLGGSGNPNVDYTLMLNQGSNNFLTNETGAVAISTKYHFQFDLNDMSGNEYLRTGGEGRPVIEDLDKDGNVDLIIPGNEWMEDYFSVNPSEAERLGYTGRYRYGVNKIIWGNENSTFNSSNQITYLPKTPSYGTSLGIVTYDIDDDGIKEIFLNKTGSANFEGNNDPVSGWYIQCIRLNGREVVDITEKIIDVFNLKGETQEYIEDLLADNSGTCQIRSSNFLNLLSISDYDNDGNLNMFSLGEASDSIYEWIWNGSKFIKVSP